MSNMRLELMGHNLQDKPGNFTSDILIGTSVRDHNPTSLIIYRLRVGWKRFAGIIFHLIIMCTR